MQARQTTQIIKALGLRAVKHIGPPLTLAAIATNAYILLAPEEFIEQHNCRSALSNHANADFLQKLEATFIQDIGIYTFMVAGSIRAVLIPASHWAYKQVRAALDNPSELTKDTRKMVRIAHNESLKAVSTIISLLNLPFPFYIKVLTLPIAAVPVFRFIAYKHLAGYPGIGSHAHYKEIYGNGTLARILTGIESASTALNVGFAAAALSALGFNLFIDSISPADPFYQNSVIYSSAAIAALVGALSVFNETLLLILNDASLSVQMTQIIAMPIIAAIICMEPSLLETERFYTHSLPLFLTILLASGGIADFYRRSVAYQSEENNPNLSLLSSSSTSSEVSEHDPINAASYNNYGGILFGVSSETGEAVIEIPANKQRRFSI